MVTRLSWWIAACCAALLTFAPRTRAADVHSFSTADIGLLTLSAIVANAAPGDIVLLEAGNYLPLSPLSPDVLITIDKPLTLVADGAGATIGMVRVTGIPAGQSVVLRNLTMRQSPLAGLGLETVRVENCAGTVLLEDCTIIGQQAVLATAPGQPGLLVRQASNVSVSNGTIRAGKGMDTAFPFNTGNSPGGTAVVVQDSKLALHHTLVQGGDGGDDDFFGNGSKPGGAGLSSSSSKVFLAGCTVSGGEGSDGSVPGQGASAAGGAGLVQTGASSWLRRVDTSLTGGAGGLLTDGSSGPAGSDSIITAGQDQEFAGSARELTLDATLREGEIGTLILRGPPGEMGKVTLALSSTYVQLAGKKGVWTLGEPTVGPVVLGAFPPSGEISTPVPIGSLLGLEGLVMAVQGFSYGDEGLMLSNPTECVLLQAGL